LQGRRRVFQKIARGKDMHADEIASIRQANARRNEDPFLQNEATKSSDINSLHLQNLRDPLTCRRRAGDDNFSTPRASGNIQKDRRVRAPRIQQH
jgi:hypothetical protein